MRHVASRSPMAASNSEYSPATDTERAGEARDQDSAVIRLYKASRQHLNPNRS
jgi:hypothetical protein